MEIELCFWTSSQLAPPLSFFSLSNFIFSNLSEIQIYSSAAGAGSSCAGGAASSAGAAGSSAGGAGAGSGAGGVGSSSPSVYQLTYGRKKY